MAELAVKTKSKKERVTKGRKKGQGQGGEGRVSSDELPELYVERYQR